MTHDTAAVLCQRADEEAQVAWCPVCRAHRGQACLGPMRNVGAHSARRVLRLAELEAVEDSEGGAPLSHVRRSHGLRGPMGGALAVVAPMVSSGLREAQGDAEPPESTSQSAY
jgi:hypothetical protein